jgi:hypothetical protein
MTDAVIAKVVECQSQPLDPIYPLFISIVLDCIGLDWIGLDWIVKIRQDARDINNPSSCAWHLRKRPKAIVYRALGAQFA